MKDTMSDLTAKNNGHFFVSKSCAAPDLALPRPLSRRYAHHFLSSPVSPRPFIPLHPRLAFQLLSNTHRRACFPVFIPPLADPKPNNHGGRGGASEAARRERGDGEGDHGAHEEVRHRRHQVRLHLAAERGRGGGAFQGPG